MSESITFEQVPADWRVPGTYVEVRPVNRNMGLVGFVARALLMGQMLTGTAPAGVPRRITRREQAAAFFGAGSVAAGMVEAFVDANPTTELWAMGLASGGGAA